MDDCNERNGDKGDPRQDRSDSSMDDCNADRHGPGKCFPFCSDSSMDDCNNQAATDR